MSTPTKCSKHLERSRSMKLKLFVATALFGLLFLASCTEAVKPPIVVEKASTPAPARNAPDAEHKDDGHDAPRISLADAKKVFDTGNVVVVDVRDASAYKQEHIKGALNIPIAQVAAHEDKLPKNKKIIVYCS